MRGDARLPEVFANRQANSHAFKYNRLWQWAVRKDAGFIKYAVIWQMVLKAYIRNLATAHKQRRIIDLSVL